MMKPNHSYKAGNGKGNPGWLIPAIILWISALVPVHAQTISAGTGLVVAPGTVVNSDNPMSVTSGGSLDVQGTLILKSNLVNQNPSSTNLGTGVIELSGTSAQTVSGTNVIGKLRINNAAGVTLSGNTQVNDSLKIITGPLDIQTTLILKGHLANLNPSATSLGNGTIELSGTSAQVVSGQNIIGKLRINNGAGITIANDTRVNGELKLKNGIVSLGSNNLLLGPSATDSVGAVGVTTSWVVVTGTGEFRKEFSTTPAFPLAFTYPVGDATVAAEYSPVGVNFTSGTFGAGNYLGVSLKNQADPNPNIASGNYLSRYWNLNNNAITGTISCGLTFNFTDADVNGTKASLYCVRSSSTIETFNVVSGNQLTGTVSSFSRFTGSDPALQASLKVFLQGPYNATSHNMNNTLASTLPLGDRSVLTNFPSNQPYNGSPWNYAGTESVVALPTGTVDWVLVELRQASTAANATAATILAKRAGFLKQDGSIVDIDGTPLKFYHTNITSNLYPVVRHRNHFATMANNAVTKSAGTYTYDYSSGSGQAYGGFGMKQVDTSPVTWATIAGDATADNNIWVDDYDSYAGTYFVSNKYLRSDFNMDIHIWVNDYDVFTQNYFISNPLP